MPNKLETMQFKGFNRQIRCPFVVYADLEAFDVKKDSFTEMLEDILCQAVSVTEVKQSREKSVKKMAENDCSWTFSKLGLTNDH